MQLTQNALTVLERRYLKRDPDTGEVCETPDEMFHRVADHIAGCEDEEMRPSFARSFYDAMRGGYFMPNSPTLMNAGREMGMLSACFVLPVEDSIDGIFDSIKATALIQKAGGGTGFSFSKLRPRGDLVRSSGGTTDGPLSFIEVFSKATDAIQQGAFRRGANMGMLRVDHPDIMDFISFKDDLSKIQNYNVSVSVTDKFLQQLQNNPSFKHMVQNPRTKEWETLDVTVGEVWDRIVEHAHATGEPGVIFIDRVNDTNPIKNVGEIEATNPCGEQPLHPYDSCNLGSINVGALVDNGQFNWTKFQEYIGLGVRFLDNVIEVNKYPLPQIEAMSKATRRIGLGVMGFADALYKMDIAYNSAEGVEFGEELMRFLQEESHFASQKLAEERGCFGAYEGSDWEKAARPMRNSYTTTVAPTGTISIIAGCSGGIEPMFSLAFMRQVMKDAEGEPTIMKEVNYVFHDRLSQLGLMDEDLIDKICEFGSIQDFGDLPAEIRKVFVTARDISPEWHMRMQAAFQKNCDSSISKTINFPNEATVEDVRQIYQLAIDLGVKGVTVYRDGCRDVQPMALTGSTNRVEDSGEPVADLKPVALPDIMSCIRLRQMTPFGNMHVKVTMDPNTGQEREVFAQLGKGGDIANSDLEAMCRLLSLWLRSGGALKMIVAQLTGIGSSLSVPTADGRIMSLPDGLAMALRRYMAAKEKFGIRALLLGEGELEPDVVEAPVRVSADYKIKCPECGSEVSHESSCMICHNCGWSKC